MMRFLKLTLRPDQLPHMERKLFHDDSPRIHATMTAPDPEGLQTLRNGRICCLFTAEGEPGLNTAAQPLFSSFLCLYKEKLTELGLHLGKQRLTILRPMNVKHFPQPKVTV